MRDCTDDEVLTKTYTQKEYRDALEQLAADADEYGNCRDVIRRAQLEQAAGRDATPANSGSGGGGRRRRRRHAAAAGPRAAARPGGGEPTPAPRRVAATRSRR